MSDREELLEALDGLPAEQAHARLHALRAEGVELLHGFLEDLATTDDDERRIPILRVLGTLAFIHDYHDEKVREAYLAALGRHETARVRATWVKNLGKLGLPEDAERILSFLDDRDPRVRANAVEGLAFLVKRTKNAGGPRVQERLAEMLRSGNPRLRINAALALFFIHRLEAEGLYAYLRQLAETGDPREQVGARRVMDAFALRREGALREAVHRFGDDSIYYLVTRSDPNLLG